MKHWQSRFWDAEKGCGCGEGEDCTHEHSEELFDENSMIEIVDPESGETYQFYYADEFELDGENYCVLVTDDEENPEYVIGRLVEDESGESFVETLGEGEDDAVYDAYEAILAEEFDEDEDEEKNEDEE